MALVLYSRGIYWNSNTTILVSDAFHQYAIFASTFSRMLHGEGSLFYTFTSGAGLNFYALIGYYLGSLFSFVYYFFTAESMANGIYLITLLKFGTIGLTTSYSLQKIYPKLPFKALLLLSTSYSLMSFATSQLEINMWLDVFMILPLIILGLHQLITQKKTNLYFVTLTLLFIENYYLGYMVAIFLFFYFLVQMSWNWKQGWRRLFLFGLVSILSALSSSIMLLPSYLDLSSHGEQFSQFTQLLTENSWYLDLFAKNLVASYDTTKYGAIPMIYVGLVPFSLTLIFFTLSSIKRRVRVAYFALIVLLVASFYLQPLDLIWQAMHAPNMFLHRYSWLLSFMLIILSAEVLTRLDKIKNLQISVSFSIISLGFFATWLFSSHYSFLEPFHFIISFTFLFAYLLAFWGVSQHKLQQSVFYLVLLSFGLFEISVNTYYQIVGLGNEWNFPSKEGYLQNYSQTESLVTKAKADNTNFFRLEKLLPQTGNDSMKFDYNGISQFSSIRNTQSSHTLDLLGFKSSGTNLNLRYQNNTLLMDSLFGIRYNISQQNPEKFGFTLKEQSNNLYLYQNDYANSLAIMTDRPYQDVSFNLNTLDNQSSLVNQLTGLNLQYFTRLTSTLHESSNVIDNNGFVTVKKPVNDIYTTVTYTVNVPAERQVYLSLPNLSFGTSTNTTVQIAVNGQVQQYTTDNTFSFFNIGYFSQNSQVSVTLQFPDTQEVSYSKPTFYALNIPNYLTAMTTLTNRKVDTTVSGNQVTSHFTTDNKTSLFYTIPYDKGWSATVNGHKVAIHQAQEGFMTVSIPKGSGTVTLTFIPNGFKTGCLLSLTGLVLYLSLRLLMHLSVKKQLRKTDSPIN
ncbi:ABC transporter, permease protein [Streptococcus sp. DD12]|nr:ABC transporter, permease protein [Streptococcus sp. DD12]